MQMKNLFFDLDGTLFEWNELTPGQMWLLDTATYYALLRPQMTELVCSVKGLARLWTCSVYYTEAAREGKELALNASYGKFFKDKHRIWVPKGGCKADAIRNRLGRELNEDDILLDDHTANLVDWENAGGMAFKVLNGCNGQGEKWQGRRMSLDGHVQLAPPKENFLAGSNESICEHLKYAVYERAVEDYLLLRNKLASPRVLYERRAIEEFLRSDPFDFGTGKIRQALGLT